MALQSISYHVSSDLPDTKLFHQGSLGVSVEGHKRNIHFSCDHVIYRHSACCSVIVVAVNLLRFEWLCPATRCQAMTFVKLVTVPWAKLLWLGCSYKQALNVYLFQGS